MRHHCALRRGEGACSYYSSPFSEDEQIQKNEKGYNLKETDEKNIGAAQSKHCQRIGHEASFAEKIATAIETANRSAKGKLGCSARQKGEMKSNQVERPRDSLGVVGVRIRENGLGKPKKNKGPPPLWEGIGWTNGEKIMTKLGAQEEFRHGKKGCMYRTSLVNGRRSPNGEVFIKEKRGL